MWPFCPQCGTILDPPEFDDNVKCSLCPFKCKYIDMQVAEVVTKSPATHPAPWAVEDEEAHTENKDKHATIEEPCPKCGNSEMYFYTVCVAQLIFPPKLR
jgi:DNA-directed RNA polymerase I subunit RPA12